MSLILISNFLMPQTADICFAICVAAICDSDSKLLKLLNKDDKKADVAVFSRREWLIFTYSSLADGMIIADNAGIVFNDTYLRVKYTPEKGSVTLRKCQNAAFSSEPIRKSFHSQASCSAGFTLAQRFS